MKKTFGFFILFSFLTTSIPSVVLAQVNIPSPEHLLSDADMTNTNAMSYEDIQAFLSRGSLHQYRTKDAYGIERSAADIILRAAQEFQLNPQLLLVTLQKEQSLVEHPSPSQRQLDWAMGYAICDDCSKSDPRLQKYRGFGNQVHQAAKQFRDAYLTQLNTLGTTTSGYGPGVQKLIDGTALIPQNNATAALYTYTPHLHGNLNFISIWNRWFTKNYPTGTLIQNKQTGAVWLIQEGKKRPIISKAAFASRFNSASVVPTDAFTISSYPDGKPINFPNYSLLKSPAGTVYLIVDDTKRHFVSMNAFYQAGFMDDDIVEATDFDLSAYADGEPITEKMAHIQGSLMQDKKTGGVFFVNSEGKQPIISREILLARFPRIPIEQTSSESLSQIKQINPVKFPDGTLVGLRGSPEVFVIDQGKRRPIADAATFLTYGWKWNQIYWTNEKSVLLQPLGEPLSNKLSTSTLIETTSYANL